MNEVVLAPGGSPMLELIALSSDSPVVAKFANDPMEATQYQSETELEAGLTGLLREQAREFLRIKFEPDLVTNLRDQLEVLNDIVLTDSEWTSFPIQSIVGKAIRIQEGHEQLPKRDDGTSKNITLLDTTHSLGRQVGSVRGGSPGMGAALVDSLPSGYAKTTPSTRVAAGFVNRTRRAVRRYATC